MVCRITIQKVSPPRSSLPQSQNKEEETEPHFLLLLGIWNSGSPHCIGEGREVDVDDDDDGGS